MGQWERISEWEKIGWMSGETTEKKKVIIVSVDSKMWWKGHPAGGIFVLGLCLTVNPWASYLSNPIWISSAQWTSKGWG